VNGGSAIANIALFVVGIGAGVGMMMLGLAVRRAMLDGSPPKAATAALRCSICGVNWPANERDYGRCPACLEPTDLIGDGGIQPLDARQARSIRLHHEFERFYAARKRSTPLEFDDGA